MANLNIHPAPGFGDLTSGFFVVPQNPIQMAREGISRVPSLGEFMAAAFAVPQNPVLDYSYGDVRPLGQGASNVAFMDKKLAGMGMGDCGCGCGGSGSCGMGALDLSSITSLAQQDSLGFGIPNWGYAAAAVIAYSFLFGNAGGTGQSRYRRARRAAAAY